MFFFTGQTIEGVDLGALNGEHNGDHATLTVRLVYTIDGAQYCDAIDDAYGREHDGLTHDDVLRALEA